MAFRDIQAFTSSNIQSARYDEAAQVLEITFLNGGVYEYYGVGERVAAGFEQAESKGGYLAAFIKGHYRYSRV
jgi:hypothetical protein